MNHLLAKTKGRNGGFHKVVSNKQIFELPQDFSNAREYSSDYKLEEDEWFVIQEFSEQSFCINFLSQEFISTDYNQIEVNDYTAIEYLCSVQDGVYFFQKISPSQILRKKYFSFSAQPTIIENEPIIVIDMYADAIYVKSEDALYFKRLASLTSVFKGIDTLFKEATQDETEEFLANDFILLNNDYTADKVKTANRKRIAAAMATLQGFTPEVKSHMFRYIKEYCGDLQFDENHESFTISDEEELKKLLYGIEQRYYTTTQGGERRLANSITKIA